MSPSSIASMATFWVMTAGQNVPAEQLDMLDWIYSEKSFSSSGEGGSIR